MQSIAIGVGIDRNRLDTHLTGRLDNPTRYLTAICDQDFIKHMQTLQCADS
jgi:hypothetical protein